MPMAKDQNIQKSAEGNTDTEPNNPHRFFEKIDA